MQFWSWKFVVSSTHAYSIILGNSKKAKTNQNRIKQPVLKQIQTTGDSRHHTNFRINAASFRVILFSDDSKLNSIGSIFIRILILSWSLKMNKFWTISLGLVVLAITAKAKDIPNPPKSSNSTNNNKETQGIFSV